MAARIVLLPHRLVELADIAERSGATLTLTLEQARDIAHWWHADLKKVRYLESLIIRMGRNAR